MTGLGRTGRPRERVGDRHAPAPVLPDRPVGADEALSMGLVDAVVPAADLERRSLAFVRSLVADRPGHVVRAVMESIRNARRMPPEQALRREGQLFLEVARATRALSTRGPDHG
jgi:enoyl-CoA hydratase/carnithine racemase